MHHDVNNLVVTENQENNKLDNSGEINYKLYNEMIEILDVNKSGAKIYIKDIDKIVNIDFIFCSDEHPQYLGNYEINDQILLVFNNLYNKNIYIYVKEGQLFYIKLSCNNTNNELFLFKIKNYSSLINVYKIGLAEVVLEIPSLNKIVKITDFLTNNKINFNIDARLKRSKKRSSVLAKVGSTSIFWTHIS